MKFVSPQIRSIVLTATALFLLACSPKYDWREIRSENAPYVVALPTKPTTFSRNIDLNGTPVAMTMVASEVDGVTFAVGSAELPDATQAQISVAAMKTAMLKNISGTIGQEKVLTIPQSMHAPGTVVVTEIEATGPAANGHSRILHARFLARENRVYQLVVMGPEKTAGRDLATTFFSSFKLN